MVEQISDRPWAMSIVGVRFNDGEESCVEGIYDAVRCLLSTGVQSVTIAENVGIGPKNESTRFTIRLTREEDRVLVDFEGGPPHVQVRQGVVPRGRFGDYRDATDCLPIMSDIEYERRLIIITPSEQ